jgi:hypothetical protein
VILLFSVAAAIVSVELLHVGSIFFAFHDRESWWMLPTGAALAGLFSAGVGYVFNLKRRYWVSIFLGLLLITAIGIPAAWFLFVV